MEDVKSMEATQGNVSFNIDKDKVRSPDSDKLPFHKDKKILTAISIGLFLLAGIFAFLNYYPFGPKPEKDNSVTEQASNENTENVQTVENPLTGELLNSGEFSSVASERPLAVMVNNALPARPQSGLVYADLVYEIVAEGGITRFIAFYLSNSPEKVGPIRSTREYYLVLVKELGDAMLMHEGFSPQALQAIETWPVRSLQRGGASFINWRDNPRNVATEHTLYSNAAELRKYGNEKLGWEGKREFQTYQFKEDSPEPADTEVCLVGACKPITIDFWNVGDYSAIWEYDKETNSYLRSTGYDANESPVPHKDQETGEQVRVKNVIVQFAVESSIAGDDKNRLDYELMGSGTGLVFMDGAVTNVTWAKKDREARTLFYDTDGNEIKFNRGKFWISIVPSRNVDQVKY